jgi:hypothetical protein
MNYDLERLLSKLDQEKIIAWLPEMKAGRLAYDFIRAAMEGGTLTAFQLRNAMHALFKLRTHANDQEVFDIYVRFSQHQNQVVRSEAVQLGLGLWQFHRQYPLQALTVSRQDLDTFRHAVEVGVEPRVAELAHDALRVFEL